MYYTPTLILPKKGLNVTPIVTPTVTPTPKISFLSVEVAGYLFGGLSTPFGGGFCSSFKAQKNAQKGRICWGLGLFWGVL